MNKLEKTLLFAVSCIGLVAALSIGATSIFLLAPICGSILMSGLDLIAEMGKSKPAPDKETQQPKCAQSNPKNELGISNALYPEHLIKPSPTPTLSKSNGKIR